MPREVENFLDMRNFNCDVFSCTKQNQIQIGFIALFSISEVKFLSETCDVGVVSPERFCEKE